MGFMTSALPTKRTARLRLVFILKSSNTLPLGSRPTCDAKVLGVKAGIG